MSDALFAALSNSLSQLSAIQDIGHVASVSGTSVWVGGLADSAAIGDRLKISCRNGQLIEGEVIQIYENQVAMMPEGGSLGVCLNDRVARLGPSRLAPSDSWIGRILDPFGTPLDGQPCLGGAIARPVEQEPPPATSRRRFGPMLSTGSTIFDTMLPLVRGQRIGLFAGSGVGKSTLLADLAQSVEADVVVLALIGERGRELRDFVESKLGETGMKRSVVIAATSDRPALERRRCAHAAMAVAEHFRDSGRQVLFVADSVTRFAEAHREVAIASGELPALKGFPASLSHQIMSLCERAGPGSAGMGDITAVFSVLVAGSDMEEPVADILRGVLDGHIVLDRQIAERGRFPAVDLLRSVSRSLPQAVTDPQYDLILKVRKILAIYESNETLIKAGLYQKGSDPELDEAIGIVPNLEAFFSSASSGKISDCFAKLALILKRSGLPIKLPQR